MTARRLRSDQDKLACFNVIRCQTFEGQLPAHLGRYAAETRQKAMTASPVRSLVAAQRVAAKLNYFHVDDCMLA